MLTIPPLPRLPREAIYLVNNGTYACHSLRDHAAPYLLITNDGTWYYLAADGEILDTEGDERFDTPQRSQFVDVVRFE